MTCDEHGISYLAGRRLRVEGEVFGGDTAQEGEGHVVTGEIYIRDVRRPQPETSSMAALAAVTEDRAVLGSRVVLAGRIVPLFPDTDFPLDLESSMCRLRHRHHAGPHVKLDTSSSPLHPASIAGLVVGAMGVFIFALHLRRWLVERPTVRRAALEAGGAR
ncbi:MAG: hypothetical protein ACYTKD_16240 [Planctomycetota bacterium]